MLMPFGKYKNQPVEELPRHYLQWLRTQDWLKRDLADAIDGTLNGQKPTYRLSEDAQRLRWQEHELFLGDFSVRVTNGLWELVHPNGEEIAWTDDEWACRQICKLLNDNKELLKREEGSSQ